MKYPKVAIIVLNYNQAKETIACLESVFKIDYPFYQVFLVDNGSDKKCLLQIKKAYPKLPIIKNKENLGFAKGNNVGLSLALKKGFSYFLLLNNDTVVTPSFLSFLVKAMEDKRVGLCGPKIYYFGQEKIINAAGGKFNWNYGEPRCIGHLEIDYGQYDKIKKVDFLSGSCLLIKKDVLDKIGFLPTDYFFGFEDVEFALKAQKAGFLVVLEPKSIIYHKESISIGPTAPEKDYYYFRNCLIFMKKWTRGLLWFMFLFFFHIKILKRSFKFIFSGRINNLKAIWQGYSSYFKGEKDKRK
jgi:GT2 family glycosyltransferase